VRDLDSGPARGRDPVAMLALWLFLVAWLVAPLR
jgi:hypothetical protein